MRISDWSSDVCSSDLVAGKALRQLRQDLQVLLRRVLRHAHREYQVDRRMVAGTEIDRVFEPQERAAGGGKRIAARVRDGHAVADRGAAQRFAFAQGGADGRGHGRRDRKSAVEGKEGVSTVSTRGAPVR